MTLAAKNEFVESVCGIVERTVVFEFNARQKVLDKGFARYDVATCLCHFAQRRNDVCNHIRVFCVNHNLRVHLRGNVLVVEILDKEVERGVEFFNLALRKRVFEFGHVAQKRADER